MGKFLSLMAFFNQRNLFYDILDVLLHFEMNGAIYGNITNMINENKLQIQWR